MTIIVFAGLSGFQALISSTSSTSFGRHGSEKMKHKKHKKDALGVKLEGKQKSDQSFNKQGGSKGDKQPKCKKEKVTADVHHFDMTLHERPNSATDYKFEFKNRKVSLSETKLIDKNDQKGKSMPSLHLIDINKRNCNTLLDSTKFPSIHLIPENAKSPVRLTPIETVHQSVPFPIITITEHSPVASMQFFNYDADGKREHQETTTTTASTYKFYIGDEQEQPCVTPSMARSKTDTEINYTIETSGESLASINYVTKNGHLSLVVILKAIHSITLKDSVCSIRICRIIYNIINKLISLKIIPKHTASMYKKSKLQFGHTLITLLTHTYWYVSFVAKKYKTFKPNVVNPELSILHLFLDSLFRIVKQLGCSRGCGEGRRENEALRLKESVMKTLKVLCDLSEGHFEYYCEMLVQSHPIQEVIDILHAFLGFCSESPAATSINTHLTAFPSYKKSNFEQALKSGYCNNFGFGLSGPNKGEFVVKHLTPIKFITFINAAKTVVESIIIKCIFKSFIMRMVFLQKELKVQENMSLYCEIRQFISYVRDHHGGIFRNVS